MADYPVNGATPWDTALKAYLDDFKNRSEVVLNTPLTDQVISFRIQDDGSSTSSWPNRLVMSFDPVTGETINTFFLNEYGEIRCTPGKTNTVAFRAFSKQFNASTAHDPDEPILEMMDDRTNRNSMWRVMPDGSMYTGVDVQRMVTWATGFEPPDLSVYPDGTIYGVY